MDSFNLQSAYALSVAVTHVLFAVVILRLYQLVKKAGLCQDTWMLRLGIILAVAGTLTLASIPIIPDGSIVDMGVLSKEALIWSISRTLGLIVLCFVLFRTMLHPVPLRPNWDGVERRRQRLKPKQFFRDERGDEQTPSNRIPLA